MIAPEIDLRAELLAFAEGCLSESRLVRCTGCGVMTLPEVVDDVSDIDPLWTVVCPECAEKVYADVAANEGSGE